MPAIRLSGSLGTLDYCPKCACQWAYVGRSVECTTCGQPAGSDHPLQQEIDREWAQKDARDRAEALRPRPPTGMSGLVYGDTAALAAQEYRALQDEVKALHEEVAALKAGRGKK